MWDLVNPTTDELISLSLLVLILYWWMSMSVLYIINFKLVKQFKQWLLSISEKKLQFTHSTTLRSRNPQSIDQWAVKFKYFLNIYKGKGEKRSPEVFFRLLFRVCYQGHTTRMGRKKYTMLRYVYSCNYDFEINSRSNLYITNLQVCMCHCFTNTNEDCGNKNNKKDPHPSYIRKIEILLPE